MKKFYSILIAFLINALVFAPIAFPAALQIDMLLSQVRTNAGGSLAGGHVHFYAAGTTTNKTVWTDYAKTIAAANPYTLDANGTALLYGDGIYRIVIHTSAGVTAFDRDNIRYEDIAGAVTRITSLTGDGTGNISGFDNLTLTGNIAGDNTGTLTGFLMPASVIDDNTITSAKMMDNTLQSGKIQDNTIASGKILDNTIALSKIAHTGTASSTNFFRGDGAWSTIPQIAAYANLTITTPADNQSVTITADKVVAVDNTDTPRVLSSVSLTVNLDVSGANGLDNGSIATNTGYFLYVIDNGATTAGLASTSATAPVMPSGYVYKALVGWCTTDNTATPFNIAEFTQRNEQYVWTAPKNVFATANSSTSTRAVDLGATGIRGYAVVPPLAYMNTATIKVRSGNAVVFLHPVTFANTLSAYNGVVHTELYGGGAGDVAYTTFLPLLESQTFYWQANGVVGSTIWISGFTLKR